MFRILSFLSLIFVSLTLPVTAADWENPPIPGNFGVNTHGVLSADALHLMREGGIGWIRTDLFWDQVEGTRGVYDFRSSDEKFIPMLKAGFRLMLILDYGNKLYGSERAPSTPEARAAFARFAVEAVKHYASHNIVWEIYNEPNLDHFWPPEANVDDYIALAAEATTAIKKADPNAIIVGPALAGPAARDLQDFKARKAYRFLKTVLASDVVQHWDAITIHPYRSPKQTPESSGESLDHIRAMMAHYGLDPTKTPLIAGEWGYSTFTQGVDEQKQAAYAARKMLWGAIQKMPFTIWYDWQDDGDDAEEKEHRFGLIRHGAALHPKASYDAVAQLAQQLNGYRFESVTTNVDGVITARFSKNASTAFVIWSSDDEPHDLVVSLPPGQWLANVLLRETRAPVVVENGQTFSAQLMPTLLTQFSKQP